MAIAQTNYRPDVSNSEANTLQFVNRQILLNVNTIIPCEIKEVEGQLYTIQPLVNYLLLDGTPQTPGELYQIPAMQWAANGAGIIIEYAVSDKVLVGFCKQDISIVKQNWTRANPAGTRLFDLRDGIILGYLNNGLPSVYVKITQDGIEIESNNKPITVNSGSNDTTINAENATINATKVDINSEEINLGNSPILGVLNAGTQFQVVGVQAGSDTLPVLIVPGTASSTVKATS